MRTPHGMRFYRLNRETAKAHRATQVGVKNGRFMPRWTNRYVLMPGTGLSRTGVIYCLL